ncbi:MAG: ECF-type sigma factor [Gemmataceae bacterium]|nr:ECF-type sigma factor [Gemmataceae bacterium]MCI0739448.1 ECF-type sigma factor [Gemmataceae bacterium]
MPSEGSVSRWIELLKAGDQAAAQPLWERYFHRLVGLARTKLPDSRRRAADEEDVALSAFDSFCRGAEAGRFPQLADRDDLWRLLFTLTARKAFDQMRDENRLKRGGGAVLGQSALKAAGAEDESPFEWFVSREPTPESAAMVVEECRRLLARLNTDQLRTIAMWKMEGYTNEEIAAKLDCAPSTIERKLQRIRTQWEEEVAP